VQLFRNFCFPVLCTHAPCSEKKTVAKKKRTDRKTRFSSRRVHPISSRLHLCHLAPCHLVSSHPEKDVPMFSHQALSKGGKNIILTRPQLLSTSLISLHGPSRKAKLVRDTCNQAFCASPPIYTQPRNSSRGFLLQWVFQPSLPIGPTASSYLPNTASRNPQQISQEQKKKYMLSLQVFIISKSPNHVSPPVSRFLELFHSANITGGSRTQRRISMMNVSIVE
jgi:hypothetical protein